MMERAQKFRARVELGLWDSDSGRARAWQYLAQSPPGSAKFGFEPTPGHLLLVPVFYDKRLANAPNGTGK